MFGLMVSEPAVCTESGWERFLGIFKELCCTAESCFRGAAVKVLLLSHVKTRQTLRSTAGALVTDPLLLPHATPPLFDFPRNFRGILLPIPNKKPAGKLWQLLVSANRTECYQHTAAHPPNISIFAKMDRYIFTSCKKNKKQEFSVDLTTSC